MTRSRTSIAAALVLLLGPLNAAFTPAAEPVDLLFTADCDGSTERVVELLPPDFDPADPHDLLIALHGHGADRWQFIREARDECRGTREAAARHGAILLSPDYRAPTSWMGPKAEADLVQIIAAAKERHRIGRVFVSGGSMGGTGALTFATLHPDLVDGVCSLNGTANLVHYGRFLDAIAASYGGTKEEVPEEYRKRSAEFHAAALTMPVALTTGGRDDIVPPESVLRLHDTLRSRGQPVLLLHRPERGHDTDLADTAAALDFLFLPPHR
jgi:dipeptidyl aminopeptidase/acylaminoacyl peptidase